MSSIVLFLGKHTKVRVISDVKLPDILPTEVSSKKRSLEVVDTSGESSKKRSIDTESKLVVTEDVSKYDKQKEASSVTAEVTKSSDLIVVEDTSRPEEQKAASSVAAEVTKSSEGSVEKNTASDFIIIEDASETEKQTSVSAVAAEFTKSSDCIIIEDNSRPEKQKTASSGAGDEGSSKKRVTDTESDPILIEDISKSEKRTDISTAGTGLNESSDCVVVEYISRPEEQKTFSLAGAEVSKSSEPLQSSSDSDAQKASSSKADRSSSPSKGPSEDDVADIESDLVIVEDISMPVQQNDPIDTEDTDSSDSDSVVVIIEDYPRRYKQIRPSPTPNVRSVAKDQVSGNNLIPPTQHTFLKPKPVVKPGVLEGSISVRGFAAKSSAAFTSNVTPPRIIVTPASPQTVTASSPSRPMPTATPFSTLAPATSSHFVGSPVRATTAGTSQRQPSALLGTPRPGMRFVPFSTPIPLSLLQHQGVAGQGSPRQMGPLLGMPFRPPAPYARMPVMFRNPTQAELLRMMNMGRRQP
nr:unnamed protein product [Callosobruchus analis]